MHEPPDLYIIKEDILKTEKGQKRMDGNLIERMNEKLNKMSKGQKKLAGYISLNYDKAVFLTAAKLGAEVGVSESTVVRFASLLGYGGYPQFQHALEGMVSSKLDSIRKIEITTGSMSKEEVLEAVLQSDAEKIKLTLEGIDSAAFEQAVENIMAARKIYIIGIRSCAPLAAFFCFYLNLLFEDVIQITTNNSSEIFEQMIRIDERDVLIGISFPRYSVRTLKAMEFANNRNSKVIAITDSKHSPMNLYSSCNLFARSDMATIVDSLVAPLSLINALIVSLCLKKQKDVVEMLELLERVWDDYQTYSSDEIDYIDDNIRMKNNKPEILGNE